jgi:ribosomal protein L37AE/L43A
LCVFSKTLSRLGSLTSAGQMMTGDPIFCDECGAAFNATSRVIDNKMWNCEFCGASRDVSSLDPEEVHIHLFVYTFSSTIHKSRSDPLWEIFLSLVALSHFLSFVLFVRFPKVRLWIICWNQRKKLQNLTRKNS